LLIVECLVLKKITISNVVFEKLTFDDCDYLGEIASEIYHKNVIFIASTLRQTMATVYTPYRPCL